MLYRLLLVVPLTACLAILLAQPACAQANTELDNLIVHRAALTYKLEQLESTLAMLHEGDLEPWQSSDPSVRALAKEATNVRRQLLNLSEQELALRQQIPTANTASDPLLPDGNSDSNISELERLRTLIASYHADLQQEQTIKPSEALQHRIAQEEARLLSMLHIKPQQLLLSGIEANVLLRQMDQQLADIQTQQYIRDIAPICSIRTRYQGSLSAAENRSLQPLGQSFYVGRVRLGPGETTLRVHDQEWRLRLADNATPSPFLIILSKPSGSAAQMHLSRIDSMISASNALHPAWLPSTLLNTADTEH